MLNEETLKDFLINHLKENHFIIEVSIKPNNNIQVFIDSFDGLSIADCVEYTKLIENHFDRDEEDYELSVSSGGLDLSFTVPQQYDKYLEKEVDILTSSGQKMSGLLKSHTENECVIEIEVKEKPEGHKRKILIKKEVVLDKNNDIKTIKPLFSFKKNKKK